jgi:hypothetical protein
MNISLIVFRFSGRFCFRFERGQKVAGRQPSILQNYNPMNISKIDSDTSTGFDCVCLSIDDTIIRRLTGRYKYKKTFVTGNI